MTILPFESLLIAKNLTAHDINFQKNGHRKNLLYDELIYMS